MKRIYLLVAVLAITSSAFSQEKGKIRVGIELGYAKPSGSGAGGGVLFTLEPKYNIANNMNVGLRLQGAALAKVASDGTDNIKADIGTSSSYVGTYDYYFHSGSSSFAPYVGAGLGIFSLSKVTATVDNVTATAELDSSTKFGGMIRGGFEYGKFRMGIEYNIVPSSKFTDDSEASVKNSYLGIHLGFYFGGGKWKNSAGK